MYKVLLVDDEDIIKIGLKSIIHWEDYGFEIIATASNGKQALELIKIYEPDVVITDIVMPIMNGLELIEVLNKLQYNGLIIVLSNYGDVNHVKTAMKLGAEDFILKFSYTKEDFIHLLTSLSQTLALKNTSPLEPFEQAIPSSPSLKLENYLLDDYCTDYPSNDFVYHSYLIKLPVHITNLSHEDYAIVYKKIALILSQILTHVEHHIFSIHQSSIAIIVCSFKEVFSDSNTIHHQIQETLSLYLMLDSSILYDLNIEGSSNLKERFQLLKLKSQLTFYKPLFSDVSQLTLTPLKTAINPITITSTYISHVQYQHFNTLLDDLNDTLTVCETALVLPYELKEFLVHVITSIQLYLYKEFFIEALDDFIATIADCNTLSMLKLACKQLVMELSTLILSANQGKQDIDLSEKIKCYIEHNLSRKITLNDLATYFSFHPNYVSSYFKERTGQTLNQYINTQKMAYAKQLLLEGQYKIKEVSHMIGIEDTFYFNRVFKRHFSCTPSEFIASEKKDA